MGTKQGPASIRRRRRRALVALLGLASAAAHAQRGGAPVETGSPNVPEFSPAFEGQTRAPAVSTQTPIRVETVATGLERPWSVAFLPDRRMLVTERPGRMRIVSSAGKLSLPVVGVPQVDARGQGGLLDVKPGLRFADDRSVYFTYYEPRQGGNGLAVARARLVEADAEGAAPRLESIEIVFRMMPTLDSSLHAGGRLVWARDGTLFVTLGERSVLEGRRQARLLDSHFGKIVRINADGSVPADNPFVGRAGARPEIWSSGHRNILAAALDGQGRLWEAEMGPRGGDELNLVRRGLDYGWPTIGYGEEYSGRRIHERTQADGLEQPVYYWDPVVSPSGMAIHSGRLIPEWRGNVFIGGLSGRALVRLVLEGERVTGEERLLTDRKERIRDVVEGPDGALYLVTDERRGAILRVGPAN